MAYIFKRTPEKRPLVNDSTYVGIKINSSEADLGELCQAFEDFLKACGFNFDGHVNIIEDEENES